MSHRLIRTIQTVPVNNTAPSDGYVLTYIAADGYWAPRQPAGGDPNQWVGIGSEIYTTRTVSVDPDGYYASHYGTGFDLWITNNVATGGSYQIIDTSGLGLVNKAGFAYTSDVTQSFVVPPGTYQVFVKMWGPGGGSGNYNNSGGGGAGGYSEGFLSVTPGETLTLAVGSGGKAPLNSTSNGGLGGWPGGGFGTRGDASGAGGGGLTGIFAGSLAQANSLIIAGGGGGSTGYNNFGAGGGGGITGGSGSGTSGKGATQTAGGLNGNSTTTPSYTAGSALAGGTAYSDEFTAQTNDCGGGGSGYWGGGAGQADGRAGGGGSGYLHPTRIVSGVTTTGNNAATGSVSNPPPNTSDPDYVAGTGVGAAPGTNGGDGYIYISWVNPRTVLDYESLQLKSEAGIRDENGNLILFDTSVSKALSGLINDGYVATGDLSGTYPGPVVLKIRGNTVAQQTLGSSDDGYVLTWNNTDGYWLAKPLPAGFVAGGDLSGTNTNQTVIRINGNAVASQSLGPSQDGYVLTWDNAGSHWIGKLATGGGGGGSPTGPAGGDLIGTYPNPIVNKIQNVLVDNTAPSNGYVLTYIAADGYWSPRPSSGGGGSAAINAVELSFVSNVASTDLPLFTRVGGRSIDMSLYPASVGIATRTVSFIADVQKTPGATSLDIQLYDITHDVVVASTTINSTSNAPVAVSATGLTVGSSNGNIRSDIITQYEVQIRMNGGASNLDQVYCLNARLLINYV